MNITDERRDPAGALRDALRRNDTERSRRLALKLVRSGEPWSIVAWNDYGVDGRWMPLSAQALAMSVWAVTTVCIGDLELKTILPTGLDLTNMVASIALRVGGDSLMPAQRSALTTLSESRDSKEIMAVSFPSHRADGMGGTVLHMWRAVAALTSTNWRWGVAIALLNTCAAGCEGDVDLSIRRDHDFHMVATDSPDAVDEQWRNVVGPMIVAALLEQPWEVTS